MTDKDTEIRTSANSARRKFLAGIVGGIETSCSLDSPPKIIPIHFFSFSNI